MGKSVNNVNMDPFSNSETKTSQSDNSSLPLLPLPQEKVQLVTTSENDKIIFEELKALISEDDWEQLFVKLKDEFPNFSVDTQNANDQNFTLVHYAASHKSIDCLRLLVTDFSAKTNIKAKNGWAPIHLVVSSDCRCTQCIAKGLSALQILLDGGAFVDACDDLEGKTPLYYCAENRLSKPAEFLLNNGANINHRANGTSVATLLAEFLPKVLNMEFDKRIMIHEKDKLNRGLKLDFRLLLQDDGGGGFGGRTGSSIFAWKKESFTDGWSHHHHQQNEKLVKAETTISQVTRPDASNLGGMQSSSDFSLSSSSNSSAAAFTPAFCASPSRPTETELLNYLLKADLAAIEAVVNHPFVEAFVHLKWMSVRKVFVLFRSLYLFLISLYTFYVFDTFVNVTCVYNLSETGTGNGSIYDGTVSATMKAREPDDSGGKGAFGVFFPSAVEQKESPLNLAGYNGWPSFSEYFKAHEMTCNPTIRTKVLAYLFVVYVVCVVFYEVLKLFESWYDYFRSPLNFAWWFEAVNIGISLPPGMGVYAHTWSYPHAAFTLVLGWILVLPQIGRIPYFGVFVGVFNKVVKDFCALLLTFSPVLLAFSLGFSVLLPEHEFFRVIPLGVFKVFLMMTGDVDFWGVFSGTWMRSTEMKGHVHIPLFIMYTGYILMVTMVLMSLLLGLAVDNMQEVRREAALKRIVRLIQEIGILESILQKRALCCCGLSEYFRRMFSITSLAVMNGPELIVFPEDPKDITLPQSIKQKLIPYVLKSCCCPEPCMPTRRHRRRESKGKASQLSHHVATNAYETGLEPDKRLESKMLRKQFFENVSSGTRAHDGESASSRETKSGVSTNEIAHRDLIIYQELKVLLEDNEKLRNRLESLQRKLIERK